MRTETLVLMVEAEMMMVAERTKPRKSSSEALNAAVPVYLCPLLIAYRSATWELIERLGPFSPFFNVLWTIYLTFTLP